MKNFIFSIGLLSIYFATTANSLLTETSPFRRTLSENREWCLHLLSNQTNGVNITENSPNFRCYQTCLVKRKGYLQDGKILLDKYEKMVDIMIQRNKQLLMNATKACIEEAEKGETECDVGALFLACHRREIIKHYGRNYTRSFDGNHHQHLTQPMSTD
ncbi:GSCOCT00000425001.3-RA-CDS [Cotesia congregata]|uniref:Odorant binding protein 2.0425 n=1 Tax=Cotesia congregata TaxID=51543 RepID=A0A8J2HCA9_COTCN|nr:GSCOCT00000425001.3-RA-CDS [Cotesia congregata]CAG5088060.1 Odorant binding protein 2.0425 [Cotesia congregata]